MNVKERLVSLERTVRVTLDRITGPIDNSIHRAMGHTKLGNKWYDFYGPNVKILRDGQVVPRKNKLSGW